MDNSLFIETLGMIQKYRKIYEQDGKIQDLVDAMFLVLSDIGLPPNQIEIEKSH